MTRVHLLLVALSLLAGCAGSGADRSTGRVRPVEELPPEYATAWRAWVRETGDWPDPSSGRGASSCSSATARARSWSSCSWWGTAW
jgi:hypothetical protein